MTNEQIAHELLRIAKGLVSGLGWYGWGEGDQKAAEEKLAPDLKNVGRLAKSAMQFLNKEYGSKLVVGTHTAQNPNPSAVGTVGMGGTMRSFIEICSSYKIEASSYSSGKSLGQHYGYDVSVRASGDVYPTVTLRVNSVTMRTIKKALEEFKTKAGEGAFYRSIGVEAPPPEGSELAQFSDVLKYVNSMRTWFDIDNVEGGTIQMSTRENGDVGEEKPGQEDINEARRIIKELKGNFSNVKITAEFVDEWVHLDIVVR